MNWVYVDVRAMSHTLIRAITAPVGVLAHRPVARPDDTAEFERPTGRAVSRAPAPG